MIISAERIKALCPKSDEEIALQAGEALEANREAYNVSTPIRVAHFMAQVAHESAEFSRLIENLNYSAKRIAVVWPRLAGRAAELAHNPEKLGNAAYASRMGNGDEESGDGWRYRGRGLIQLTGRWNYRTRGTAIEVDLLQQPHLAAEPDIAARIALSFWNDTGCNPLADADDVKGVTRRINGGLIGLDDRTRLTNKAKMIFVEPKPEASELIA